MAARRLVTVMLVLLGISIVAAALVPPPVNESEVENAVRPPPPEPAGALVRARIDAGAPEPRVVEIRVGDQLALTVRAREADQVQIPALGELQFVGPLSPARFDILAWEEATYAVRLVDADRLIGRIAVGPAREGPPARARGLGRGDRGTPDAGNTRDE